MTYFLTGINVFGCVHLDFAWCRVIFKSILLICGKYLPEPVKFKQKRMYNTSLEFCEALRNAIHIFLVISTILLSLKIFFSIYFGEAAIE